MNGRESRPLEVVKVGGSLFDWPDLGRELARWLKGRRALIVPGGGEFAEAVRKLDRVHGLGQKASHEMAVRCMDLSARVLAGMLRGACLVERWPAWEKGSGAVSAAETAPDPFSQGILLPHAWLEAHEPTLPRPLPHHWDVTSDSIAATVAGRVGADRLVLIKSTGLPPGTTPERAAALGLVDPYFPEAVPEGLPILWVDLRAGVEGWMTTAQTSEQAAFDRN